MKRRPLNFRHLPKERLIPVCLLLAVSCLLFFTTPASALPQYWVRGYVYASTSDGLWDERDFPYTMTTSHGDAAIIWSPTAAQAKALYKADIAAAAVQGLAEAVNGYGKYVWDLPPFYTGFAKTMVGFGDTLTFTIEPGFYPDGLEAHLIGHVSYCLQAYGTYSKTGGDFEAKFDRPFYATRSFYTGFLRNGDCAWENFDLVQTLVEPGKLLSEAIQIEAIVSLRLGFGANVSANTEVETMGATATSNFYNTGQFTALVVPPGVTWTSASGVFLTLAPLPASLLFLGSGLGILLTVAAASKRRERS